MRRLKRWMLRVLGVRSPGVDYAKYFEDVFARGGVEFVDPYDPVDGSVRAHGILRCCELGLCEMTYVGACGPKNLGSVVATRIDECGRPVGPEAPSRGEAAC